MKTSSPPADRVTLEFSGYGLPEVPLVGRYTYSRAHPPLRRHLHPDVYEVCLLQRGTQTYVIGSERFDLTAGDMIITRPSEVHGTATEPMNRGSLYWVQFVSPARSRPFLGLPPRAAGLLVEPLRHLTRHQFHNCDLLLGTFERIFAPPPPNTPKALAKASVQNLLLRLLLDIVSLTGRTAQHACSAGVRLALRHMAEHSAEHVTLARLASAAGTSESYLKAHFKREVGMTPMEYLMWLRVEKAKRALRESATPVTALALDLGFATSQHFATVFKRLTGHTPRTCRRLSRVSPPAEAYPVAGTGPSFHPVATASGHAESPA